ncbi:carbohydrate ABC transporter permease [Sediminispirochaeta smaragdinae]|uniref:Binding-protein-dependent transport systems inner membrane component n=1 Tax=Sediminispirochaeta smaragdinae (strain DSM 11293 / JCM 15392 / SEBR 4228) TaxID=573413 RepID=E1RC65_SEDSS|nr:sugar ABC transporter permease [Sediminispirochaeta smaragdinae]ADK79945.1 binding-protein-dependent transport systems inner membrane component [Sediminispirochaeta smaragdinae DSM 11293]
MIQHVEHFFKKQESGSFFSKDRKEISMQCRLRREEKIAYKMVLPYVVAILFLVVVLLSANIISSFRATDGGFTLRHYTSVVTDDSFPIILRNTFTWTFFSVLGQMLLGLIVALLLNNITTGETFFRSLIIILPWGTLDIVAGVMWKWMYNDLYGVLNDLLLKMGIIKAYIPWLASPNMAMTSVIIANIWKGFVLAAMFFLARLKGIPAYMYEVAEIDGANIFQRFFSVTLPQLRTVLISTLMLVIIWTINYFPLIYIMTGGGPGNGTETLVTYIYKISFRFLKYGDAAALSNILFLFILIIVGAFMFWINKEEVE